MIVTRFAPSPTGYMHVGSVRIALINFLYAKKHNGKFILRIDNTDVNRNVKGVEEQIIEDLAWVGVSYDDQFSQSERGGLYAEKIEILKKNNLIYPCYETQEELQLERQRQLDMKMPPIYSRKALELTKSQIFAYQAEGRKPHYRFYLGTDKIITWNDLIRQGISLNVNNLSDPIVVKEDGNITYLLSSVIDDIDCGITHIIRGEDHIINTATQIVMFKACSGAVPAFGHLSLITSSGKKISKRKGGYLIQDLKGKFLPISVANFLVNIGTDNPISAKNSINEMIKDFDLSEYSTSISNYEEQNLIQINKTILSNLDQHQINEELNKSFGYTVTKDFWDLIKYNVKTLEDILLWHNIIYSNIKQNSDLDKNYLQEALALLPGCIDNTTWEKWTSELSVKTRKKGRDLYLPLRLALTGEGGGPCMKNLLVLLGREKIVKRLSL